MKKNNSLNWIHQLVIGFFILMSPMVGTYAACCAGHGGVASCNKTTGYKTCKDGTASPSCTCPKAKTPKKVTTKKLKTMTIPPASTTTTKTKSKMPSKFHWGKKPTTTAPSSTSSQGNWWSGKSTPTTIRTQQRTLTGAKGCCSRHGGVSGCNRMTHHQICRDGVQSPTCLCQ